MGFQDTAQIIIISRKSDLHDTLRGTVDLIQQVYIPKDAVRLRLYRCAESIFMDDLEAFPCQTELFFTMHIRI